MSSWGWHVPAPLAVGLVGVLGLGSAGYCYYRYALGRSPTRGGDEQIKGDLSIPGPTPTHPQLGNLGDIGEAGSLHQYLCQLHQKYGDGVVGFWWGTQYVVSISTPETFKDTSKWFNRPVLLFQLFQPLIGANSIQYKNNQQGRDARRHYINPSFSIDAIKAIHWPCFLKTTKMILSQWTATEGQPVPIHEQCLLLSLHNILHATLGIDPDNDDLIKVIKGTYEQLWHDMELRVNGQNPLPGSSREVQFEANLKIFQGIVQKLLDEQEKDQGKPGGFLKLLKEHSSSTQEVTDELITHIIGGFHTSGNLLTWLFYFVAKYPEVQAKIQQEVDVYDEISLETIPRLTYTKKVINETLRKSVLAPWAARYSEKKEIIGGYCVPEGTPVIQALGVCLSNKKYWKEGFAPEENDAAHMKFPTLQFVPFGFAGGRVCPGQNYTYYSAPLILGETLKEFNVYLCDPSHEAELHHGLVTSPKSEIYLKFQKRKK